MLGYNRMTGYNKARYNADGTEIQKADGITLTDDTVTRAIDKLFSELFVTSDDTAKQQNKAVVDTIKLDVWLSQNRDDASRWGD